MIRYALIALAVAPLAAAQPTATIQKPKAQTVTGGIWRLTDAAPRWASTSVRIRGCTKNDNLAALGSLVAQVHGYGDAAPDIRAHAANITRASSRGSRNRRPRRSCLTPVGRACDKTRIVFAMRTCACCCRLGARASDGGARCGHTASG